MALNPHACRSAALAVSGALCLGLPAPASPAAVPGSSAHAIVVRAGALNPSLASYEARVHVNVRMLNFPFLSPKLDGTSYFKRPDKYAVVFDRVPGYARGFEKLFSDIGEAVAWERDYVIVYEGVRNTGGRPAYVLRLTKRIHSDRIKAMLAYVDPSTYEIERMEWHYYNGGSIVMTQSYRDEGSYRVVSTQHADIAIPHVHAVADAAYTRYRANVAVDNAVFTSK